MRITNETNFAILRIFVKINFDNFKKSCTFASFLNWLTASGNELFYYTFPDENNHNYEIDFLLSRGNKICPIEVKSSGYKTHKSLDEFCKKYSARIGDRYLVYTKDWRKDGVTLLVPVYMTGLL